MMSLGRFAVVVVAMATCRLAMGVELLLEPQEISTRLTVGYAVHLLDMNADGRDDIVVVDSDRVIWFENPSWELHTILEGQTKRDNVSLAAADINGDGRLDFALGADWRPSDTRTSGSLSWLAQGSAAQDHWVLHPIDTEPTIHRIRFADLDADGRPELVVVPLFGRGATAPEFAEAPVRILSYKIPVDPAKDTWEPKVLNEELHVAHNFWPTDLNRDGRLDLVVASFEGVSLLEQQADGSFQRRQIGTGNQETSPSRGASEVKHGQFGSGEDYLATIEPWHGFQVVVYTRPQEDASRQDGSQPPRLWDRQVLDDELKWGHAVWCIDLDGDREEELVIGVRDTKDAANPCGLRVYDPLRPATDGSDSHAELKWGKQRVDPGGVAIEDLACGDLNGDGRPDIVAVGRQTKNVRIYWNRGPARAPSP